MLSYYVTVEGETYKLYATDYGKVMGRELEVIDVFTDESLSPDNVYVVTRDFFDNMYLLAVPKENVYELTKFVGEYAQLLFHDWEEN